MDLKLVVRYLSNGNLEENLCLICLAPLGISYENVHTKIFKEENEFSLVDILRTVCQIEFSDADNYNVCHSCFVVASVAYKFYLQTKQSQEILKFYTDEILRAVENYNNDHHTDFSALCIPLPVYKPETPTYNFDLRCLDYKDINPKSIQELHNNDNNVILIKNEGEQQYYKFIKNSEMALSHNKKTISGDYLKMEAPLTNLKGKPKRKRGPMTYKSCRMCPVKYRFTSKLQQHMKLDHNIVLYVCKICKAMTEDQIEHQNHINTHTNVHECALCGMVFKKRDTIISHLKWHDAMRCSVQADAVHICEICGMIFQSEDELSEHCDKKHTKKFTCYYCGKMYKSESSFEIHINKHEEKIVNKEPRNVKQATTKDKSKADPSKPRCACDTCGRSFVDQRTLMWHQRLHSNERPYVCDVCGRGFVSLNRRNQHRVCAHSAPSRRCPLCPALFHLRSMVNTHLKKVHLKAHKKRRNRTSKYQDVPWRTETVPIQELSVSIQDEILELQNAKRTTNDVIDWGCP